MKQGIKICSIKDFCQVISILHVGANAKFLKGSQMAKHPGSAVIWMQYETLYFSMFRSPDQRDST